MNAMCKYKDHDCKLMLFRDKKRNNHNYYTSQYNILNEISCAPLLLCGMCILLHSRKMSNGNKTAFIRYYINSLPPFFCVCAAFVCSAQHFQLKIDADDNNDGDDDYKLTMPSIERRKTFVYVVALPCCYYPFVVAPRSSLIELS